jgi:hypothetical protein
LVLRNAAAAEAGGEVMREDEDRKRLAFARATEVERQQTAKSRLSLVSPFAVRAAIVGAAIIAATVPAYSRNWLQNVLPQVSDPIRPDPRLTPGAVMTTDPSVVCHPGYAMTVRHTSGRLKHHIYVEYGLDRRGGHYEVDHLIPLSIGGSDVAENLWPQSYETTPWNAEVKDRLEWKLLHLVCHGDVPMDQAQHEIARDWIAAYRMYCPTERDCPSYESSRGQESERADADAEK